MQTSNPEEDCLNLKQTISCETCDFDSGFIHVVTLILKVVLVTLMILFICVQFYMKVLTIPLLLPANSTNEKDFKSKFASFRF